MEAGRAKQAAETHGAMLEAMAAEGVGAASSEMERLALAVMAVGEAVAMVAAVKVAAAVVAMAMGETVAAVEVAVDLEGWASVEAKEAWRAPLAGYSRPPQPKCNLSISSLPQ